MTYQEIYYALKKEANLRKQAAPFISSSSVLQAIPAIPGQRLQEATLSGMPRGYYQALDRRVKSNTPFQAVGAYIKNMFTNGYTNPVYRLPYMQQLRGMFNRGADKPIDMGKYIKAGLGAASGIPALMSSDKK